MMKQKMNKKLGLLLMTGVLLGSAVSVIPVRAADMGGTAYLSDEADLLTEDEEYLVLEELSELAANSGWETFVLTTEDANGYSTMEYSERFLNENIIGDDGLVYTIDMDNREVYLTTTGEAIYYLTDDRIEDIIDSGYTEVSNGYYADAFLAMIQESIDWYQAGIPSDQYIYDEDTGEIIPYKEPKAIKRYEALIALAIAAGAFAIVFVSVLGKYRLKWGTYKYDFHANGDVLLSNQEDQFVNKMVTHRRIPKQTSSGGSDGGGSRSSVHSGAGGRNYGGGGRKF